jgi:bifunctional non-homologous end joining protein LigD
VRPTPDARVSAPITWAELPECEPADFTLRTVPGRFARVGDVGAGIDDSASSLEPLLELSARQRAEGQGDAPWPPHYAKGEDEPPRVAPSRRRGAPRRPTHPLVVVARAAGKEDALAGLERWKERHPEAAARLAPEDVLVDAMRGRYTTWTRVRVNLQHVPETERPPEEAPDPDFDQSKWDPRD